MRSALEALEEKPKSYRASPFETVTYPSWQARGGDYTRSWGTQVKEKFSITAPSTGCCSINGMGE
jgi:hypothetical protein